MVVHTRRTVLKKMWHGDQEFKASLDYTSVGNRTQKCTG